MEPSWVEAEKGYALALSGPKRTLICRNKKGKQLASVPSAVRKGETAQRLLELREWLTQHERTCASTVDTWMLGALPVPRGVVQSVWVDTTWRAALEYAVVAPTTLDGTPDWDRAGLLRGVDPDKGVGVVDLDGESEWLETELLCIPHPVLLPQLQDFRELLTELQVEQGLLQLFRETFVRPESLDPQTRSVDTYVGGKFEEGRHAVGRSRSLGYRVRGGYATCPVFEAQRSVEARFWIGADEREWEIETGELTWVDEDEKELLVTEIGDVAYSEGVRMASLIYAGRVQEKETEED